MFNGRKKVPTSLKECYATDSVSRDLWSWSEWVKKYGKIVFVIMLVIGVISSIMDSMAMDAYDSDMAGFTLISSLVMWALYAFIEYATYNVVALLIASLASIVQNTKVTADVTLYRAAKDENYVEEVKPSHQPTKTQTARANTGATHAGEWICTVCETKNKATDRYCVGCGRYK